MPLTPLDSPVPPHPNAPTFKNPIVSTCNAGDPWVIFREGFYYFTATLDPDGGLWVWKSRTLTGMDGAEKVKVWTAHPGGMQSRQIWAPELHYLRGNWSLYYCASDGVDSNHRMYVLEAATDDPLVEYIDRGRVDPGLETYVIDGSVLEMPDGSLYFTYTTGSLWIAPMDSPLRVSGPGVRIARADREWEKNWVEAPQALVRDGRVFIVYSAGHSARPHYVLGMLTLTGGDPLNPDAWVKHPEPVFEPFSDPTGCVYTTGHNSFTVSPDGAEDWIVYHAKDCTEETFEGRTARAQRFTWNDDGTPHFGRPIPAGVPLSVPSGEESG